MGYAIKVEEQTPEITESVQRDVFHGVMLQYIILKNYLEDERDRQISTAAHTHKKQLKPKFIKEIIEELTEDYDLPDVEIRKVLIEELTKDQLMLEEEAERLRIVEEQEKRRLEELDKQRLLEEEAARLRAEAEERVIEILRQQEEAERAKREVERLEQALEDSRRGRLFDYEIGHFDRHLERHLREREELKAEILATQENDDFADAVAVLEEQERLRQEEHERMLIRRREELKRIEFEKNQEKLRLEAEAAIEWARKEEERRIAAELQRREDEKYFAIYSTVLFEFFDGFEDSVAQKRGGVVKKCGPPRPKHNCLSCQC